MKDIYDVKITKQAKEQMVQIVDYISKELFAPDAAFNLLDKLENSIMTLSEFPERYQLIDEEPWRSEGVRKIVVNNFFVYYWINIPDKKVQVTAIIYSKRNQLKQLKLMDLDK